MGELEARRLVLVDPELDSESTRREVADLLSDAVTNLTLVSSSPTYGVLDGDLITISRALGLTIPADGFGYRCRHGEHLPSVKSSPL